MGPAVSGLRRTSERSDPGAECRAREGKGLRRAGEVPTRGVVIPCVYLRQSEPVPQGDHPTIEDREIRERRGDLGSLPGEGVTRGDLGSLPGEGVLTWVLPGALDGELGILVIAPSSWLCSKDFL